MLMKTDSSQPCSQCAEAAVPEAAVGMVPGAGRWPQAACDLSS